MAQIDNNPATATNPAAIQANEAGMRTLRNTYRLLSMTLAFAALTALGSASLQLPHPGLLITLGGYFGLLFLTHKLQNSGWGIVSIFALTGFMGYTMGPILNLYMSMANGPSLIATAFGTTAVAFFALSAYARSSGAIDMMKMGNFLVIGILTAFCLGLAAYFFEMPMLSLAVSGLFVLLMSGLIMYETQNIIRGGETNYIMATVTLFVALYNMFMSLLHIFGFMSDD